MRGGHQSGQRCYPTLTLYVDALELGQGVGLALRVLVLALALALVLVSVWMLRTYCNTCMAGVGWHKQQWPVRSWRDLGPTLPATPHCLSSELFEEATCLRARKTDIMERRVRAETESPWPRARAFLALVRL